MLVTLSLFLPHTLANTRTQSNKDNSGYTRVFFNDWLLNRFLFWGQLWKGIRGYRHSQVTMKHAVSVVTCVCVYVRVCVCVCVCVRERGGGQVRQRTGGVWRASRRTIEEESRKCMIIDVMQLLFLLSCLKVNLSDDTLTFVYSEFSQCSSL